MQKTAQRLTTYSLPSIKAIQYKRCLLSANNIAKDNSHPNHKNMSNKGTQNRQGQFSPQSSCPPPLLDSRAICSQTIMLRNSIFPMTAIQLKSWLPLTHFH